MTMIIDWSTCIKHPDYAAVNRTFKYQIHYPLDCFNIKCDYNWSDHTAAIERALNEIVHTRYPKSRQPSPEHLRRYTEIYVVVDQYSYRIEYIDNPRHIWEMYTLGTQEDFFNKPTALTPEEKAFCEAQHDLVYKYMRSKKLDPVEWYDVVIWGLIDAVRDWFRKDASRKYEFGAIAFRAMEDCRLKHLRAENADMRKINHLTMSLDAPLTDDDSKDMDLYNVVADSHDRIGDYETNELIAHIARGLTDIEIEVLQMLIDGYTHTQIKREMGLGRDRFDGIVQKIQNLTMALM